MTVTGGGEYYKGKRPQVGMVRIKKIPLRESAWRYDVSDQWTHLYQYEFKEYKNIWCYPPDAYDADLWTLTLIGTFDSVVT